MLVISDATGNEDLLFAQAALDFAMHRISCKALFTQSLIELLKKASAGRSGPRDCTYRDDGHHHLQNKAASVGGPLDFWCSNAGWSLEQ